MDATNLPRHLFVFDPGVAALDVLQAELLEHALSRGTRASQISWLFLQPGSLPPWRQIVQKLEQEPLAEWKSIQLFAHARPAALNLCGSLYGVRALRAESASLRRIGEHLESDAVLSIYACELGKGKAGEAWLRALSHETGASIQASSKELGWRDGASRWTLDRVIGPQGRVFDGLPQHLFAARTWRHALGLSSTPIDPSVPGRTSGESRNAYAFAALRADGSVITWGNPTWGGSSSLVASQINGSIDVKQIFSTGSAFAALLSNGAVVSWGGPYNFGANSTPVASLLNGNVDVVRIYSTDGAFAALRADGSVVTWGGDDLPGDPLGMPTIVTIYGEDSSAVGNQLNGTIDVSKIFSTSYAFAALRVDGSVVTWGEYHVGGNSSAVANQINGSIDVTQISASSAAFAALRADGSVVTWGSPYAGGDSSAVASQINGSLDVTQIFATDDAFAALRADGSLVTWGDSTKGGSSSAVASQINGTIDVTKVFSTLDAFAALRADGSVVTWGNPDNGGNSSSVASQLNGTVDVTRIFSTGSAFAALRADGSVVTWGVASYGGNSSSVASQLNGTIDVTQIFSTGMAFAALRADGSVVTWGESNFGGNSSAVATQLNGTIDITKIFSTSRAFAALRADGSVVTWGYPDDGGNSSAVASQINGTVDVVSMADPFANDVYTADVVTSNHAPVLAKAMFDLQVSAGKTTTINRGADMFTDPDGDPLSYSLSMANGGAAPSWLSFTPSTGSFVLTPSAGVSGVFDIVLRATDTGALSASDTFRVTIAYPSTTGDDSITGSDDANLIDGGDGDDVITGGGGDDILRGGAGIDMVVYASAPSSVTVNLALGYARGGDGSDTLGGFENISGSAFGDTLYGDASANEIRGNGGADYMAGGGGNDTYYVDNAADIVDESARPEDATPEVVAGDTVTIADTEPLAFILAPNSLPLLAAAADVVINIDKVIASINYTLRDFLENLLLSGNAVVGIGNALDNQLVGNALGNQLDGQGGNDTLNGGAGNDTLSGGSGNDVFEFAASGNGTDRIGDLQLGDRIRIAGAQFSGGASSGNGSALGLHGVQYSSSAGVTILYIGTDATPGADLTLELNGLFESASLRLAGSDIQVNTVPTLATPPALSFTDTSADDAFVSASGNLAGSDADGDALSYGISNGTDSAGSVSKTGSHGMLTLIKASGAYSFAPNDAAIEALKAPASETFGVTVSDGVATVNATLTVNVNGANDPTVFGGDTTGAVTEDGQATSGGTLTVSDRDAGDAVVSSQSDTVGVYGAFSIASNGVWTYNADNSAANVQGLKAGQSVIDTFSVLTAGGGSQNVVITLSGANDPTVFGGDTTGAVTEDGQTTSGGTLMASDRDAGDAVVNTQSATPGVYGVFSIASNGVWTYKADNSDANVQGLKAGQSVIDTFSVLTAGGSSQNVVITLSGANDAPLAADGNVGVNEGATLNGALSASDVDGDTLSYSLSSNPAHGVVTVNSKGSYAYTPSVDYSGADSFAFLVSDGLATDSGSITIAIDNVDTQPSAALNDYAVDEDGSLSVAAPGVLANDSLGGDGGTLSATLLTLVQHGHLTLAANGGFTYTPTANYNGGDHFSYAIQDSDGDVAEATVSLTINAVNDAPTLLTAVADQRVNAGTSYSFTVPAASFTDVEGAPLAFSAALGSGAALPAWLSFSTASRTFSGTPAAADAGDLDIRLSASDGEASGSDVFRLTVESPPRQIQGNASDDVFVNTEGNEDMDGGAGIDLAVYQQRATAYEIQGSELDRVLSGPHDHDTLLNVERLRFDDAHLAFDIEGNAGQVYRLYKAAFARTPDFGGLGGWIGAMDQGTSLEQVANAFVASGEFQGLYGANPEASAYVKSLYLNVMSRAPGAAELDYWVNQLNGGLQSRAQVLLKFSESPENRAAVQDLLADGILYLIGDQVTAATQGLTLMGTANADTLYGSVARDTLIGLGGDDGLHGGNGIDTAVYAGARAAYLIARATSGLTVDGEGSDTLAGIERLQFSDQMLAFDTEGNAGQVYRLYQAAFDRTPDTLGLSGWIRGMDGGMTLRTVASGFIGSEEFKSKYGAHPTDEAFVTLLYQNVLNRAPDDGGKAYWLEQLANGMSQAMALMGFSESGENQAAVIGVIQNGIEMSLG